MKAVRVSGFGVTGQVLLVMLMTGQVPLVELEAGTEPPEPLVLAVLFSVSPLILVVADLEWRELLGVFWEWAALPTQSVVVQTLRVHQWQTRRRQKQKRWVQTVDLWVVSAERERFGDHQNED